MMTYLFLETCDYLYDCHGPLLLGRIKVLIIFKNILPNAKSLFGPANLLFKLNDFDCVSRSKPNTNWSKARSAVHVSFNLYLYNYNFSYFAILLQIYLKFFKIIVFANFKNLHIKNCTKYKILL